MAKPTPKRVPSDSCGVRIDGQVYYPHEGEYVELIATETVGELRLRVSYSRLPADIDAVRGEPDEGRRLNEIMDRHYQDLIGHLAERVFSWDWTDLKGRALPQPCDGDGNPLGLLKLRADELYWLLNAVAPIEETEDQRKNA